MISPLQVRAMRLALTEKLATRTTAGDTAEQMSGPRWKQTAFDLPAVAVGAGLGYGAGRVLSEGVARTLLKSSPVAQQRFLKAAPYANVALSSMGAYALGRQRGIMRDRRDEAEALAQTNGSVKQARDTATGLMGELGGVMKDYASGTAPKMPALSGKAKLIGGGLLAGGAALGGLAHHRKKQRALG
ncbi:MAG: hypothetical protein DRQ64_00150 [Gammaproteobacteria bacterium]|nr:MAG: hypothetical protein DRQ64_00150 [Gammaproteobacteria bacterium]